MVFSYNINGSKNWGVKAVRLGVFRNRSSQQRLRRLMGLWWRKDSTPMIDVEELRAGFSLLRTMGCWFKWVRAADHGEWAEQSGDLCDILVRMGFKGNGGEGLYNKDK
jgi:hypothetical protein